MDGRDQVDWMAHANQGDRVDQLSRLEKNFAFLISQLTLLMA